MKETIVHPFHDIWSEIHDVPIPKPGPNEVVIKVFAAGSNVKDWLHLTVQNISLNSGDDIAGIVYKLGKEVASSNQLHINDRVYDGRFQPKITQSHA